MAATRASSVSERMESRRWPPDFISPGPRVMRRPRSKSRASCASDDSRTSSARARVIAPSSALGQGRYSASATIMPTRASPRNSRRSLWRAPALRCVSACASSPGSRETWPANVAGRGSVVCTGPRQHLGGVELSDDVEVGDHRLAHLVADVHLPAVVDALDLDVLGLHVFRVADVQPAEEQVLD